jgi:hypothetical protein
MAISKLAHDFLPLSDVVGLATALRGTIRLVTVASGLLTWPLRWLQGRLERSGLLMIARCPN